MVKQDIKTSRLYAEISNNPLCSFYPPGCGCSVDILNVATTYAKTITQKECPSETNLEPDY